MSSLFIYFYSFIYLCYYYCFYCIFTTPPPSYYGSNFPRLHSSMRNQPQRKIYSEADIQFLLITGPTLESNVNEKGDAEHSPRYSQGKIVFEVDVNPVTDPILLKLQFSCFRIRTVRRTLGSITLINCT